LFKEDNKYKLHFNIQFLVITVRLSYINNQLMFYMETNRYFFVKSIAFEEQYTEFLRVESGGTLRGLTTSL